MRSFVPVVESVPGSGPRAAPAASPKKLLPTSLGTPNRLCMSWRVGQPWSFRILIVEASTGGVYHCGSFPSSDERGCRILCDFQRVRGFSLFMKNKLKRYYGRKDLHFITFSCYQRKPLLDS